MIVQIMNNLRIYSRRYARALHMGRLTDTDRIPHTYMHVECVCVCVRARTCLNISFVCGRAHTITCTAYTTQHATQAKDLQ